MYGCSKKKINKEKYIKTDKFMIVFYFVYFSLLMFYYTLSVKKSCSLF